MKIFGDYLLSGSGEEEDCAGMREIKFRAWDSFKKKMLYDVVSLEQRDGYVGINVVTPTTVRLTAFMQFTGLRDKNGLTDIYEGDILDENGLIRGNVYESPQVFREGIDCVITGMGTSVWRGSESIAMGRGCKYSE